MVLIATSEKNKNRWNKATVKKKRLKYLKEKITEDLKSNYEIKEMTGTAARLVI